MLNTPVSKLPVNEHTAFVAPRNARHHIMKQLPLEKSGRLSCNDEQDIEVPSLEIFTGR
jgi:hypothetical protein